MGDVTTTIADLSYFPKSIIFSSLDADAICEARLVSKEWNTIINDYVLSDPAYVRQLVIELYEKIKQQLSQENLDKSESELSIVQAAIDKLPQNFLDVLKCNKNIVKKAIENGFPVETALKLPSNFTFDHIYAVSNFFDKGIGDKEAIEAVTRFSEEQVQAVRLCRIPYKTALKLPSNFTEHHIYAVSNFLDEGIGDKEAIEAVTRFSEEQAKAIRSGEIPYETVLKLPSNFTFDHIHAVNNFLDEGIGDKEAIEAVTRFSEKQALAISLCEIPYEAVLKLPSSFTSAHIKAVGKFLGKGIGYKEAIEAVKSLSEFQAKAVWRCGVPYDIALKLPSNFTEDQINALKYLVKNKVASSYEEAIEKVKSLSEFQAKAIYVYRIPYEIALKFPSDFIYKYIHCEIPDEAVLNLPGSFTYAHIKTVKRFLGEGIGCQDAIKALKPLSDGQVVAIWVYKIPYKIVSELPSNFTYDHIATVKVEEEGSNVDPIRFSSVPSASIISEPNTSSNQSRGTNIDPSNTSKVVTM